MHLSRGWRGAVTHKVVSNLVSSLVKGSWVSSAVREKVTGCSLSPFTQQTFIECLLCVKHSVAKLGPRVEVRHFILPQGTMSIKDKNHGIDQCHRPWLL